MAYQFLSDEWFDAVQAIPAPPAPANAAGLIINVVVTRDGADEVAMHMGDGQLKKGLNEGAATTLTTPYEVAKALFIDQDQNAAMQAFMSGRIKVTGDMTKLMMLGQQAPSAEQEAYTKQIHALTVV